MLTSKSATHVCYLGLAMFTLCMGCNRINAPPASGTAGLIHVGNKYCLPDVQVTVFQLGNGPPRMLGVGVSSLDGKFQLLSSDGKSPLWLKPNQYAFTLESVGHMPLAWNTTLKDPTRTPLRMHWTDGDTTLDLDVPEPRVIKQ